MAAAPKKVKVEMLVSSWSTKAGQIVEVEKETAEALIRNRHAISASESAKRLEAEILGTAPEAE